MDISDKCGDLFLETVEPIFESVIGPVVGVVVHVVVVVVRASVGTVIVALLTFGVMDIVMGVCVVRIGFFLRYERLYAFLGIPNTARELRCLNTGD